MDFDMQKFDMIVRTHFMERACREAPTMGPT